MSLINQLLNNKTPSNSHEIKYFVRTTENRIFEYDLNYKKLIDTEHKPVQSFIAQLKYISQ